MASECDNEETADIVETEAADGDNLIYNFPYRLFVRINPLPSDS